MGKSKANVAGAHCAHLNPVPEEQEIPLMQINLTNEFHFRLLDDENTIKDYMEIYRQYLDDREKDAGAVYPLGAIHVLREKDVMILKNGVVLRDDFMYFVVAGRHRFLAAQRAGLKTMPCIVHSDRLEAITIGLGSNKHGLPLNRGDKKRCIEIAVKEFPKWSNRRIADQIGCSEAHVRRIVNVCELRTDTHVEGKDGKSYPNQKVSIKPILVDDSANRTDVPVDRILDELKAALELPQEKHQRTKALIKIVETILLDSFTGDSYAVIRYRLKFMKILALMVEGFWTTPRNSFRNGWHKT